MIRKHEKGRSIEAEVTIDADAATVWAALSSPEEIQRWFPLHARGSAEPGGTLEVSWDEENWWGMEVEVPEPGRHLRLVTREEAAGGDGGQVLYVDIHVGDASDGTTVRLVHSGFGDGDEWDGYLDGLDAGWGYFVRNLELYVERHFGSPRTMVWRRAKAQGDRAWLWTAALSAWGVDPDAARGAAVGDTMDVRVGDDVTRGVVQVAVEGRTFAALLPAYDHSILFLEVESEGENGAVGLWVSTYEAPEVVRRALETAVETACGALEGAAS